MSTVDAVLMMPGEKSRNTPTIQVILSSCSLRMYSIQVNINELDICDLVNYQFIVERMGGPFLVCRISFNNGSMAEGECRSRLVIMETKRRSTINQQDEGVAFNGAPPLKAVGMLAKLLMYTVSTVMHSHAENDIV